MKRHPLLQPLSDDHHRALVLARHLRRAPTEADAAALARETREAFTSELEPHFRVEETLLLPALARCGAGELVLRTADDHARLRALVAGPWSRATAGEVGTLLERHVRFEERVVFPEAETLLSEPELASLGEAATRARG